MRAWNYLPSNTKYHMILLSSLSNSIILTSSILSVKNLPQLFNIKQIQPVYNSPPKLVTWNYEKLPLAFEKVTLLKSNSLNFCIRRIVGGCDALPSNLALFFDVARSNSCTLAPEMHPLLSVSHKMSANPPARSSLLITHSIPLLFHLYRGCLGLL
jgi:hypothetical protein